MSNDGFPQAVEALKIADTILRVAHAREMTMPHFELNWLGGEVRLEVKWFPTIDKEPIAPLVEAVEQAYVVDEWDRLGTSMSHSTTMHGVDVEFTIYT